VAERNNLVPHESSNVGRFAEIRISNDVQIRNTGQPDGLADTVASGFLNITEEFSAVREPNTQKKCEDARSSILRLRRKTARTLIGRMKLRMPLRDPIGLAGNPEAVRLRMRKHCRDGIISRRGICGRGRTPWILNGLRILRAQAQCENQACTRDRANRRT
jgi:hypothetical protein